MLVELPNGDWTPAQGVRGLRLISTPDRGPQVSIQYATGFTLVDFDDMEAARGWKRDFARRVNAAMSGKPIIDGEAEAVLPDLLRVSQ